jgi:hypothetical protein
MTDLLYELTWPSNRPAIRPLDDERVIERDDGSCVVRCTRSELEAIVKLAKDMGFEMKKPEDILSVRTTTWLVRVEDGQDTLLVKSEGCTIVDVMAQLVSNPSLASKKYFVYPIVEGTFHVNVEVAGFCIPLDRRILNEARRVVVDPDVQVMQPLREEIEEGF